MRLRVRVPATVANLGPGFDCFGLALALHNDIEVETEAEPGIEVVGEGAGEIPLDASNLVSRSIEHVARATGRKAPPCRLTCHNGIPVERGLGSSAAAVVVGLLGAERLLDADLSSNDLLQLGAELEGHADNAAAALAGGAAIAHTRDGVWHAERIEPLAELRPVALIPEVERMGTADARLLLPRDVSREDATFNAAHTALLAIALTSRPELLSVALEDRLHQDHRLELAPQARLLFRRLTEEGVPVCVAGSGPTLLAFETGERPAPEPGAEGWRVMRLDVDREGARVLEQSELAG